MEMKRLFPDFDWLFAATWHVKTHLQREAQPLGPQAEFFWISVCTKQKSKQGQTQALPRSASHTDLQCLNPLSWQNLKAFCSVAIQILLPRQSQEKHWAFPGPASASNPLPSPCPCSRFQAWPFSWQLNAEQGHQALAGSSTNMMRVRFVLQMATCNPVVLVSPREPRMTAIKSPAKR